MRDRERERETEKQREIDYLSVFMLYPQVTQSLGNLVVPQICKEVWMEPLLPFMAAKISSIRNFLEDLITVNVEDGKTK